MSGSVKLRLRWIHSGVGKSVNATVLCVLCLLCFVCDVCGKSFEWILLNSFYGPILCL